MFIVGAFVPYAICNALELSGITSILFCGIIADYYTYYHLSPQIQTATKISVNSISFVSESFVFIYLGMSFFLSNEREFRVSYAFMTLFLCLCGRAISVFPLAFLLNCKRKNKIPFRHQLVLWYSGLRGPCAYALALATPSDELHPWIPHVIITTTLFVVGFTTFIFGGLAYIVVKFLKPPPMSGSIEEFKLANTNHWFNKLDQRFLRPRFGPYIVLILHNY